MAVKKRGASARKKATEVAPKPAPEPRAMFIGPKKGEIKGPAGTIMKAQQEVLGGARMEDEDDFAALDRTTGSILSVPPPFSFLDLERIYGKNSILTPLVAAMTTNVDGTGGEILPNKRPEDMEGMQSSGAGDTEAAREEHEALVKERKDEVAIQVKELEEFFAECWPGVSFMTVRKKVRRDLEVLGNAYIELMRTKLGDLVGMRWLDAKFIRLVKLDRPVTVERTMMRGGQEVTFSFSARERRYVQAISGNMVYFKEHGSKRQLSKTDGKWESTPDNLSDETVTAVLPEDRATEIIHMTLDKDATGPYGIPRWISNIASVVGSRKAEEFNLEFFDAGGVPPLMIIVQGGQLATDVEAALEASFLSKSNRHQATILEAYSTTGDIDSAQNVKVTVERFGADRQKDSMFEGYVEKADKRTQRSFRIPDIFLGMGEGTNFATAFVSMMTADAQVFEPERAEFDEMVNLKIMPELPNGTEYTYHSLSLSVTNAEQQLKAVGIVSDMVEPESMVDQVNKIASTELMPKAEQDMPDKPEVEALPPTGSGEPANPADNARPEAAGQGSAPEQASTDKVIKMADAVRITALAAEVAGALDTRDDVALADLAPRIRYLKTEDYGAFRHLLAQRLFAEQVEHDPDGCAELATALLGRALSRADGQR